MNTISTTCYGWTTELRAVADADVSAARPAAALIAALSDAEFQPAVAAQIVAVLRNRIGDSPWSHWPLVQNALQNLDDAVDLLQDAGE